MAFEVFEADLETPRWVNVERLDDEALFVSTHCSKAISAHLAMLAKGEEVKYISPTTTFGSSSGPDAFFVHVEYIAGILA